MLESVNFRVLYELLAKWSECLEMCNLMTTPVVEL